MRRDAKFGNGGKIYSGARRPRLASIHATGWTRAGWAVALSPRSYNQKTGLALFCPVTSRIKGYPFEVKLPDGLPVTGVVLCDQVKSLDWSARLARLSARLSAATLDDILAKMLALLR